MQRLDNEVSKVFLELIGNYNVGFQLLPAHIKFIASDWDLEVISCWESVALMADLQCICGIEYYINQKET